MSHSSSAVSETIATSSSNLRKKIFNFPMTVPPSFFSVLLHIFNEYIKEGGTKGTKGTALFHIFPRRTTFPNLILWPI